MAPPEDNVEFHIDWGMHLLMKLVETQDFHTVLDIGAGDGEHKRFLEYMGKDVRSVDFDKEADYQGDFMEIDIPDKFDCIWCSHVIEHQRNVGDFLDKLLSLVKDDGVIAIACPGHSQNRIVAGHLTAWSIWLLCYNLILAGQDCSEAMLLSSYELSLLVKRKKIEKNPMYKNSVIGEEAFQYFPIEFKSGYENSNQGGLNWGEILPVMPKQVKIINTKLDCEIWR